MKQTNKQQLQLLYRYQQQNERPAQTPAVPTESAITKYNVSHAAVVKYMLCFLTLIIHVSKKE